VFLAQRLEAVNAELDSPCSSQEPPGTKESSGQRVTQEIPGGEGVRGLPAKGKSVGRERSGKG
jgi:hypothetical protein